MNPRRRRFARMRRAKIRWWARLVTPAKIYPILSRIWATASIERDVFQPRVFDR